MRFLVAALMLAGCAHAPPMAPPAVAPVIDEPAPPVLVMQRECEKVDKDWLRQLAPAEGSMLVPYTVSRNRRAQIEQLNNQLAKIGGALKRGCLELP